MLRKADEKRGNDPKRKEFMKKYAQTEFAKLSHLMAKEKYCEKLGVTRRRAQYRKYKQTQIDKVLDNCKKHMIAHFSNKPQLALDSCW